MDQDDAPVGRMLSRREVVGLLGVSGITVLTGRRSAGEGLLVGGRPIPACVVRPEQTEGPYFVDEMLHRSDIRADPADGAIKTGVPLALAFVVSRISRNSCAPLAKAQVDLWHCDADGVYSGVTDATFNTVGKKFLRGYQVTDAGGTARFGTIYPGWYPGRAVHLHFKIRTDPTVKPAQEFTSQLYFEDALSDQVFAQELYASRGARTTRNRDDRIFLRGGDQLMLAPALAKDGYAATFEIGLDLD